MGGLFKKCASIMACDIVEFLAGEGLVVDPNSCCLNVSTEKVVEDSSKTTKFTVLTDSVLTIDAKTLTLKNTYTTYKVKKSHHGQILGIEFDSSEIKNDIVTIPDGYGYGYGITTASLVKDRESTKNKPNFYNK